MTEYNEFYRQLHSESIMLTYKGEINSKMASAIMETVEPRLNLLEPDLRVRKRLYNIFLECIQNIVHHQVSKSSIMDGQPTLVLLTAEEHAYCIRTGNTVSNDLIHELKEWLDVINTLSPDELKISHLKILDRGDFSNRGTAGLGFIDIARRSGQQLRYAFERLNESYSIFSFLVTVPRTHAVR